MKAMLLTMFVLSSVAGNVQARLNETGKQFEARYGKPTPSTPTTPGSDRTLVYSKAGIRIAGEFVKDHCLQITYSGRGITQEIVDTLLKANGEGSSWAHYKGGGPNDYVRADGLATAKADPASRQDGSGSLRVTFVRWQKAHDQAIKDSAAAKQAADKDREKKLK